MILALIGAIIGIALGWTKATKRGGNTADKLQYAAGFGIAFLLVGYFASIFIVKLGL